MAQRRRDDGPGAWHHVMNRGIAKRTVFESRRDVRAFLAALACEVRRGCIEVHAYSILVTHFHILLRSPLGQLSAAMRRVLNRYVRYFNRTRARDGSLLRGRFRSRPVRSVSHGIACVRYIDHNPVSARICRAAADHLFGSARHHVAPTAPPWLSTAWIRSVRTRPDGRLLPYAEAFPPPPDALRRLVEQRIRSPYGEEDPLDRLLGATPAILRRWMQDKTHLADQTKPGIAVCDAKSVRDAIAAAASGAAGLVVRPPGGRAWPAARIAAVALLRDLGGMTYAQIAAQVGCTQASCVRAYAVHAHGMREGDPYAGLVARLTAQTLTMCHGARRKGAGLGIG